MKKPLLIYDGDCRFCRWVVDCWRERTGHAVDFAPSHEVAEQFPEISTERFDASVQLILPEGQVIEGADAVLRTLSWAPRWGWPLWLYRRVPGVARVAEWVYARVSANRHRISPLTRRFWDPDRPPAETYALTRRLFLMGLGLIYAIAFASLGVQITGLIGENGVWPAARFLDQVAGQTGAGRYLDFPTLFWFAADDAVLQAACWAGTGLGAMAVFGVNAPWLFLLLWLLYLSLVTVGGVFLLFQWDSLLLETGFLAIFLCSFRRESGTEGPPPSQVVLWLLRWLLFRLMFFSGVVKLASGDPAWRELEALLYHYETQPLPTWIGWYVHQWPEGWHRFTTLLMFGVELILPFFIFVSRCARVGVFWVFFGLQAIIFLTGNYGYFNLLSVALGIVLLDDRALALVWLGSGWRRNLFPPRREPAVKRWLVGAVVAVVVLYSGIYFVRLVSPGFRLPDAMQPVVRVTDALRLVNPYGLFAVMTRERPEIVLEGSMDGKEWKPYEFKWKPGDVNRAPEFVAPHQPRLDWQMWFAALGDYRQNPWLIQLMVRLLQGTPEVLALVGHNPFPNTSPKYLRALLYDYRFTDTSTRARTGAWWQRTLKGPYAPYLKFPATDWPEGGFAD